jgi:hypothetical protein
MHAYTNNYFPGFISTNCELGVVNILLHLQMEDDRCMYTQSDNCFLVHIDKKISCSTLCLGS